VKQLRSLVVVGMAVLAMALVGCGSDSNPAAPAISLDSTPPPAPTALQVTMDGPSGGYLLQWTPSAAPDVAAYQIYQFAPDPSRDNAYVLMGQVTRADFLLEMPEDASVAILRVQAVDASGNHSAFSNALTVTLTPGSPLGYGAGGSGSTPGLDKDPKRIIRDE